MSSRAGFWQQPKVADEPKKVQRNESAVSKQFQPSRERNGSTEWLDTQSRTSANNHGFTPFKSVKDANGKAEKGKADPFEYTPSAFANGQHQAHSTPKIGRPGSAVPRVPTIPRGEKSYTWGRNGMPAPQHYRSVSAMGHPNMGTLQRAPSRTSDVPVHTLGSRYQSYTTLPRPEPMDAYRLEEQPYYAQQHYYPGPQPKMIISRPPSALPMGSEYGPMMAPPHMPPPPQSYLPTVSGSQTNPNASIVMRREEIVAWNTLWLFCSLKVVFALAIFAAGAYRMLVHAKWAYGVEFVYAFSVFIAGLIGIGSVRNKSYCAATFAYILAGLNFFASLVPFTLGVLPFLSYFFPDVAQQVPVTKNEPWEVDCGLALAVATCGLISFLMVLFGCKALGNTCRGVEQLRIRSDLDTSFGAEPLPVKQ
ncbi:unnamed protein product, partial [Mesorhabditis spiculigera]